MKTLRITAIIIALIIAAVLLIHSYPSGPVNNNKGSGSGKNALPSKLDGFSLISNRPVLLKNETWFLYIGTEACPYCAAESWSVYYALENYGSWGSISQIYSNSTDIFPNTPGLSFYDASYSSTSTLFTGYEVANGDWEPLQTLNQTDSTLFKNYDSSNGIPFILIDGIYLHIGSAVDPHLLANLTTQEVLSHVNNGPSTNYSKAIWKEGNNITEIMNAINNYTRYSQEFPGVDGMHLSFNSSMIARQLKSHFSSLVSSKFLLKKY